MGLSDKQFGEIHKKLKAGGFTVDPRTGEDVTSGWSVAPRDNERKIPAAESTPGDVRKYTEDNASRFVSGRATKLGGWEEDDENDVPTHYLDTPTVHPHTPGGGGHARARRQQVLSHQIAAMNLDKIHPPEGEPDFDAATEYNPFHPVGRLRRGLEQHEIANAANPRKKGDFGQVADDTPEQMRKRSEFAYKQPEVQAWVNSPRKLSRDPG
jgi:hypothetical protein